MVTDSFYRKTIIWSLLGLAFVPVVITSNTLVSLIIAKVAFTRFLIALALVFLAMFLFKKKDFVDFLNWSFLKSPIFISLSFFTILAGISTFLAGNPYRSFFGTILRGEGYVHLLYMFTFFALTSLVFRRKQWLQFFKASIVTGAMVSADTILSYIQTGERAEGIFLRNPTFISAYLLFAIFSALIVLVYENRRSWKKFSYAVLGLSVIGLAVSNTRSIILGLIVALLTTAFYLAVKAGGARVKLLGKHISIRNLVIQLFILLALFGVIFIFTLNNSIWERVPGLNRFSELSTQTQTIQSRFVAAKISLASINPTSVGFDRFLFGWGPDSYNVAFNKYFDPKIQRYETKLFDRAHNQVMDVLVMNGLLGLVAYLSIWFFAFRATLTASLSNEDKGKELLLKSSMIFFAVAYFVHNLAFFDQISTYVPVFVFWGFSSYVLQREKSKPSYEFIKTPKWIAVILGLFLLASFYVTAFIPYRQTSKLTEGLRKQNPTFIMEHMDEISSPLNYAQAEIRKKLVLSLADIINDPRAKPLINKSWALMEEIISLEPQEPRNMEVLALSYQTYGENSGSPELIKRAEELFRQELELIPGRQETLFLLAKNLITQGRLEEALGVADDILATDSSSANANLYYSMIMAPLDWSGAHGIDELMKDLFYENRKAFNVYIEISEQEITYYRNMHRLYLVHYARQRDGGAFRSVLSRAIRMEDILQSIQTEQIPNGFMDEPMGSMKQVLEQALNLFDQFGWEGVSF
ncbi:MAG: hypothetical protein COT89_00885 [Candidatus Colwellbacteria bacterium CG10_big_fil_rev_8_21_14_0_10_42_22]|uniref:O-antigen ligase-related domain-containing protein n=1 Tax=Candidatus Colwellbacteria bacterium CG10_big_fil_rev_8_21_14_0_10_42_22 TaxID=1974540 RepID=A0A2H0VGN7_9BACT|nr:MAG: hypothetical protein COT89_00885 [Candidatus Colwellbacteria bacterium CG10_big_fil_rev_8_21_14_0_10_42_22]